MGAGGCCHGVCKWADYAPLLCRGGAFTADFFSSLPSFLSCLSGRITSCVCCSYFAWLRGCLVKAVRQCSCNSCAACFRIGAIRAPLFGDFLVPMPSRWAQIIPCAESGSTRIAVTPTIRMFDGSLQMMLPPACDQVGKARAASSSQPASRSGMGSVTDPRLCLAGCS